MKGKHIRKEKKSIVWILIALFVLIGVIFGYFHFKSDDQEDLSQYETIVGTIKNVGDETLLIETNDHQKYLIWQEVGGKGLENNLMLQLQRWSESCEGIL